MRIQIREKTHSFQIMLPTKLVFNPLLLHQAMKKTGPGAVSTEAVRALTREISRVKEIRGTWTLVEIHGSGGEEITVTL